MGCMKTEIHVRPGLVSFNHNETLVPDITKGKGLRVKTRVKAGVLTSNHNETLVADRPLKFSRR
jgi:hypothetical protein